MPFRTRQSDRTAPEDVYLLYHAASNETGERLGQYLGVEHGTDVPSGTYETLIRWGGRQRTGVSARCDATIQPEHGIANASNKFEALQQLDNTGVPVPAFTQDRSDIGPANDDDEHDLNWPVLGRDEQHSRGSDIELLMQYRDAYLVSGKHHYVDYIPTRLEYRMHVVDGDVIKVHEKRLRSEADMHPGWIRNQEHGWVFVNPREAPPDDQLAIDAIEALDLDFGAVDVIRAEGTDEEYVLEVNTAPSLDRNNLERYANALADSAGMRSPVGGHSAVDWSDTEDTEDDDDDDDEDNESDT